jgi:hypothetical protein
VGGAEVLPEEIVITAGGLEALTIELEVRLKALGPWPMNAASRNVREARPRDRSSNATKGSQIARI